MTVKSPGAGTEVPSSGWSNVSTRVAPVAVAIVSDGGEPAAVKVTVAVLMIAAALTVPLTVALPAVDGRGQRCGVGAVGVVGYCGEGAAAVVESATVSPPAVRFVPEASLSRTVIVEVEVPSATIDDGLALIVEVAPDAGPGAGGGPAVKVTVAVLGDRRRVDGAADGAAAGGRRARSASRCRCRRGCR